MLVRVYPALLLAATVSTVDELSVSDPLPVQPLTVKVLPPAVSVRLAVVNPLKVNVAPPATASEVLARTTLLDTTSARVSVVPLSVPPPVQPVTVKVLPPEPLSVRLAVVIPTKPSDIPSVEDSELLASVNPAPLTRRHRVPACRRCRSATRSPSSR